MITERSITWAATQEARQHLATEHGAIVKDWGGRLPVAMVYPDTYQAAMSSLGYQTLYALLNSDPRVVCERVVFSEKNRGLPLSLESQRPLSDFPIIAFSAHFELQYFTIVQMLKAAGIPPLAADRSADDPLIIGGGPCFIANPEPVAPFFDVAGIGEGEMILPPLIERLLDAGPPYRSLIPTFADIPGVYIPSLYEPVYDTDGNYVGMAVADGAPTVVQRALVSDVRQWPVHSIILTEDTEFSNMYVVEVARGCGRWCRFCIAGFGWLPVREQPMDTILALAQEGLKHTRRIGLLGASVGDHSQIDAIATALWEMGAQVSAASLRVHPFSEPLARSIAGSGTKTITLGIEAGSERLRTVIHKDLSEEQIWSTIDIVSRCGFRMVKLYFMIGLPTETEEDIDELIRLSTAIHRRTQSFGKGSRAVVNVSHFVPKAQTPFQWADMAEERLLADRLARIRSALQGVGIEVRTDSIDWAAIEGLLARGDRRLAPVLAALERNTVTTWKRSLAEYGIDRRQYLNGPREEAPLPWDVVATGVRQPFLLREWQRALAESPKVLPTCPPSPKCRLCGVCTPDHAPVRVPLLVR